MIFSGALFYRLGILVLGLCVIPAIPQAAAISMLRDQPNDVQPPPAVPAPAPGNPNPYSVEQAASNFIRNLMANWSSPNDRALRAVGPIYESSVVYFGKVISRQAVLEDKRRFVERWPQRSYSIQPGTLDAHCDGQGLRCEVWGMIDWKAANDAKRSRGSASFQYLIRVGTDGTLKIAEEAGKVVKGPITSVVSAHVPLNPPGATERPRSEWSTAPPVPSAATERAGDADGAVKTTEESSKVVQGPGISPHVPGNPLWARAVAVLRWSHGQELWAWFKSLPELVQGLVIFGGVALLMEALGRWVLEQWQKKAKRQQQQTRKEERSREHEDEDRRERERAKETSVSEDHAAWWDVLGVDPLASLEELKASYRTKIKQYHPDRVVGLGEEFVVLARDKSQRLNQAYEEAQTYARTRNRS
jgi:DnaJ domain